VKHRLTILGLLTVLWCVLWLAVIAHAFHPEPQEFYFTVAAEGSHSFQGVEFYQLRSSDGTATVTVDGDAAIGAALKALSGQRVKLTLEPATLVLKKVE
jgi:hypothetical protein